MKKWERVLPFFLVRSAGRIHNDSPYRDHFSVVVTPKKTGPSTVKSDSPFKSYIASCIATIHCSSLVPLCSLHRYAFFIHQKYHP